jgi:proteasome assembly chaperone (PAC2) family protein
LEKTDFVILTGDTQPALDDVVAHYIVCGEILDFLSELDCNFVVTLGGVPSVQPSREIYVAASSSRLAVEFMERGAIIYGKGRILGAAGLMLGLAKERGWDGVSLLGATTGLQADKGAGFALFKFLVKTFGGEVKEGL